jgi:amidohydrolase
MRYVAAALFVFLVFAGSGSSQTTWTTPTTAGDEECTGPAVMLRTELDALPVEEKTELPFASKVVVKNTNGQSTPVMHACGHDIHMSAWAGTARLMAEHKDRWRGTLVMAGQPAEEGGGASAMLKDGLFTRFPRPDFALPLHDDDIMPAGTIGYHPGPFRSMLDGVTIIVHGRGGHAAMPMNTVDPVVLASRIVLATADYRVAREQPYGPGRHHRGLDSRRHAGQYHSG